jgi:lon-related putative ATP-dependent protease
MATELSPEQLCRTCNPAEFNFQSTAELEPLTEIIGQPRATRAIGFGIEVPSYGFNVFAMGPAGAGKTATIRQFLEPKAALQPQPPDWCYVNNFADPYRPKAVELPAGRGAVFRRDMANLVKHLQDEIPQAFETEAYQERRQQLVRDFQEQRAARFNQLEAFARERGFTIVQSPMGLMLAPMLQGQPLTQEQFETLDPALKEQFRAQETTIQEALERTLREVRDLEKEAQAKLEELDREVAAFAVDRHLADLKERYTDCPAVLTYLDEVREDIINNVDDFRPREGQQEVPPGGPPRPSLSRYEVNLIVDNGQTKGAPIVVERNPTYSNLVGRVEHKVQFGALVTDFTMIKPGALHRANGGYLVVEAAEVLKNPFAWDALKRALRDRMVCPEEMGTEMRVMRTVTLDPEPIPLRVKVILTGDARTYYMLYNLDEEFRELFKVVADFDVQMDRTPEALEQYARFIATRCREENLRHLTADAVARVVEYSSRLVEDQHKLSTRFSEIADIVREASYWAGQNGHDLVTGDDVLQAIKERMYRSSRLEERIRELIADGAIRVDTEGAVVGQVNGISILQLGDYEFGKPSRITATTYAGKDGVVNIDREVKLSGPIHDKGMLILTSYLGSKYAQQQTLTLSASLVFEQAYEEVEGDSASSAELYALLSSLSGLPLNQGIAVTGSVDQAGNIQPVGGVTRKVEGFFDVCRVKGLTGKQGVIIPHQNVRNLMLREDVVEAVRQGKFHIWPIKTIDEGIEILTGVSAGELQPDGTYPEGTVNARVMERLRELAQASKEERESGKRGAEQAEEIRKRIQEFAARWKGRAVEGTILRFHDEDFVFRPHGMRRELRLSAFGQNPDAIPLSKDVPVIIHVGSWEYGHTRSRRRKIEVSLGELLR